MLLWLKASVLDKKGLSLNIYKASFNNLYRKSSTSLLYFLNKYNVNGGKKYPFILFEKIIILDILLCPR